jgi:hypothetical protein
VHDVQQEPDALGACGAEARGKVGDDMQHEERVREVSEPEHSDSGDVAPKGASRTGPRAPRPINAAMRITTSCHRAVTKPKNSIIAVTR